MAIKCDKCEEVAEFFAGKDKDGGPTSSLCRVHFLSGKDTEKETPAPTPAPAVADQGRALKLLAQLEARVEALENYAREQGAKLQQLTTPAAVAKKQSRFYREA